MSKVAGTDLPSFILAAGLTPVILLLLSASPFYFLNEFSDDTVGKIASVGFFGVVFGFPFYLVIGLPLAWVTLRRSAVHGNRSLLARLMLAAAIANTASLMLVAASCFPLGIEHGCSLLALLPFALLGFPHAMLMGLTFSLFYIGVRTVRGVP